MYQKSSRFLIKKFVNHLIQNGKKNKAEKLFLEALQKIHLKTKCDGFSLFLSAIENTKPCVELRSIRRGGTSYFVPVPVFEKRSISLAMKWLSLNAFKKSGSFSTNLANTIIDASKNLGDVIKKRNNLHETALKNRSFTHYRWF